MALNKRLKNSGLFYEKLGYTNADPLYQDMGKSADYMYIGFLTQIGTDVPTERTLYNDFLSENAFTFTYENVGKYRMYCNLFKPGYVEVEINEAQNNAPTSSIVLATVYDGYVEFTALDGGSAMDDILYNTPVKVKVWANTGISQYTPVLTTCLYATPSYNDSSQNCFTDPGWDFNGQGVNFNSVAAAFGGYAVVDGNTAVSPVGTDTCSLVKFFYLGTNAPPDIVVTDPNNPGAPPISFTLQSCSFGNLTTGSIFISNPVNYGISYLIGYISTTFSAYGAPNIDLANDLAGAQAVFNTILNVYCPGASVTITQQPGSFYTFTFNNVYYFNSNLFLLLVKADGTQNFVAPLTVL